MLRANKNLTSKASEMLHRV